MVDYHSLRTAVAARGESLSDKIMWLTVYHPELTRPDIAQIVGTTSDSVRALIYKRQHPAKNRSLAKNWNDKQAVARGRKEPISKMKSIADNL